MARFRWNKQSELAADLLIQGNLKQDDIAERVGVTRRTIWTWRQDPVFKARVDDGVSEYQAEIRRVGLALMIRRVQSLCDRWNRMIEVIEARAGDPQMQDIPGGSTGLLTKTVKGVGRGEDFRLVATYEVDTGLLRELREHEKQAAQELGQWITKIEVPVNEAPADPGAARAAVIAAAAYKPPQGATAIVGVSRALP